MQLEARLTKVATYTGRVRRLCVRDALGRKVTDAAQVAHLDEHPFVTLHARLG